MSFFYIRKEITTGAIYYDTSRGIGFDPIVYIDPTVGVGFIVMEEDIEGGFILLENGFTLLLES